jgi:hypothetical protein
MALIVVDGAAIRSGKVFNFIQEVSNLLDRVGLCTLSSRSAVECSSHNKADGIWGCEH